MELGSCNERWSQVDDDNDIDDDDDDDDDNNDGDDDGGTILDLYTVILGVLLGKQEIHTNEKK